MERLSIHQFFVLSAAVLLGMTFFNVISFTIGAGRDAWMSVLPGFMIAIPIGFMLLSLMPKYPGNNLIEITGKLLGKWIGKGIGFVYIVIVTYIGGLIVVMSGDLISRSILPRTPHIVFLVAGMMIGIYLFYSGIEVLGRFSEIVFPIVSLGLITMAIFIIPRFEQGELFPILAEGLKPVLLASVNIFQVSAEYTLFLAGLLPFLPREKKELKDLKKGLIKAVIIIIFLNTLVTLIQILTFGPVEAARLTYGLLVLGKMIEIARTISGVESIFVLIWMGAAIIKITSFIFASMWGIKTTFGLKSNKCILVIGAFYFLIFYNFPRGDELINEIAVVGKYVYLPFTVAWVLLVWGVDKWKRRPKTT